MIRHLAPAALAALVVLAGTQACAPALQRGGVNAARMRRAERDTANWLSWGRTYDEQRFSPLQSINDGNVGGLGLAWYADLGTYRGVEGTPLVVDGVLYNTSAWNITSAYDAKSGSLLWSYDPQVAPEVGRRACCDIVSRGLAVWQGKVIIAALDGRLIALDARSGAPVWSVQTFEGNWPYTITGAPRVFDGRVLIGNGGAEFGVRGYVSAYDAETGRQLWRFYTVPGDPAKGFENQAMEMAAKTWHGEWWRAGGGGTVWDAMAYDPKLKLIYVGVGNGSPWAQKHRSRGGGDNLFLASIVALNADTGAYVWHYQETPGEQFDSTATQQMVLADLAIGGRTRRVIMQAPKNGFFYVLDRRTGELLSADAFMHTTWATHVDMKTGRPVETPEARYGEKPVALAPHAGGGHNFNPVSYSPATGLVYFSVVQSYGIFAAAPSYTPGRGTGEAFMGYDEERKKLQEFAEANTTAWLAAWDPVRRREAWRVPYPRDGSGGVLATAGNLVFQGTINRSFAAYRADSGAKLWEMPVQNVAIAGPITYSIDGEQYIAVNAGWGGGLAHFERAAGRGMNVSTARLLVFKLGGTAQLPPLPDAPPLEEPPTSFAPEATIQAGAALYAQHCALCHGAQVRGGIRDLRQMSATTHREFDDVLLRGTRARAGMAGFADLLSPQDVAAIHAYVIARAREDWGMVR